MTRQQANKDKMICDILADLRKLEQKEQAYFYIEEKPVPMKYKFEMERIHSLESKEILEEIEVMLNKKNYDELVELHSLIGIENE